MLAQASKKTNGFGKPDNYFGNKCTLAGYLKLQETPSKAVFLCRVKILVSRLK